MPSVYSLFLKTASFDFGIQWLMFLAAAWYKTEKFYDLTGSATFLFLAYQTLQWNNTFFMRQKIQSCMVATWAFRLGTFLFNRILKDGHDSRFNNVRDNPKKFFVYWTIQGVWIFITLLPTLIVQFKKTDTRIGYRDYVGWALWGSGFLFEVIADYQKSVFKVNPANQGKFISTGLWSISRHPNYFGEILLWFGLFISSSSTFRGLEGLSVFSPMFIAFLLTKVSGIPLLEKAGLKRWGQNQNYLQYRENTASLIPWIW